MVNGDDVCMYIVKIYKVGPKELGGDRRGGSVLPSWISEISGGQ